MDFPGKNTIVGCHFLLQMDLPNPGIACVSHVSCIGKWVLYHWATWGALLTWHLFQKILIHFIHSVLSPNKDTKTNLKTKKKPTLLDCTRCYVRHAMLWTTWIAWKKSPASFWKIHISVTTTALFTLCSEQSLQSKRVFLVQDLQTSRESLFLQLEIQSFFLQGPWKGSQAYLHTFLWTDSLLMRERCFAQFPGWGPGQTRRFCLLPLCFFLGLFRLFFFCL